MSIVEEAGKDKGKTYNIVVNGRPRVVHDDELSYRQVVRLAYFSLSALDSCRRILSLFSIDFIVAEISSIKNFPGVVCSRTAEESYP